MEPEPTRWYENDHDSFDNSGKLHVESHRPQETSYPSWREPARPRPRPEPVTDFWSVAEARSRTSAVDVEPELPKQPSKGDPAPASPSSPSTTTADQEDAAVPSRAVQTDLKGRLKKTGLIVLTGILIVALGVTVWSWTTRGTWESAALWPFGASTSAESQDSPALTPAASPDPESTEGARPANSEQVLDDTSFTVPEGWKEYGEDQPSAEPNRRVVRLQHSETDIRLQVTSFVEIPETSDKQKDLLKDCEELSKGQQERFTSPVPMPASQDKISQTQGGSYTTCGFTGVRTEDNVPNTVMFTFLLRISDGHVLALRSIIPDSVAGGAAARQELAAMNCTASLNFGVTLPPC